MKNEFNLYYIQIFNASGWTCFEFPKIDELNYSKTDIIVILPTYQHRFNSMYDTKSSNTIFISGVSYLNRKLAFSIKSIVCLIKNEDGTYSFIFKCKLATSNAKFIPGEKFIETKADGSKVNIVFFKYSIGSAVR